MKNKVYNTLLILLIISLLITLVLIALKYYKGQQNENDVDAVIEDVKIEIKQNSEQNKKEEESSETPKVNAMYKGYDVLGLITIPKINIEYPILSITNDKTLNISITKFFGNEINEEGNFTMAGHNYLDGRMFGFIHKLNMNDEIQITDLSGRKITYKVFDKYLTDPKDSSCVNPVEENTKEITLITCKNRRKNRLIVKAREI